MKQFHLNCGSRDALCTELEEIRHKGYGLARMMFTIYLDMPSRARVKDICDTIEAFFPDAQYMGCSTDGTIVDCALAENAAVICTVFEEPSTTFDVCQYELSEETMEQVTEEIVRRANENPGVKAIEIYFSLLSGLYMKFCKKLDGIRKDVLIVGGLVANVNVTTDECCVFTRDGGYSNRSVIAAFYGGDELHVMSTKITGWRQLQRTFHITKANACTIYEIDGYPAYDLYKRYLAIPNDENFFYNTLEFPLYYEHNGLEILRAPVASNPDGSITVSSDIDEGAMVQFSYGDPKTVLDCVAQDSGIVRDFGPDVIHIFSCAARKAFWQAASPTYELTPFADIAPTQGFFTRGELMRNNGFLNLHNVTLVILAMREGARGEIPVSNTKLPKVSMEKMPLVSRIANFIAESARELEEFNSKLKVANDQLELTNAKLSAAVITDGLTGLFNRKEIQSRIEASLHTAQEQETCLIMLDIDNFKNINDTYGHQKGDAVIIALADILRGEHGVPGCQAGRWGGEEFMLLLSDAGLEKGISVAEQIRGAFAGTSFAGIPSQTVSLGVTKVQAGDSIDSLCTRVDAALYEAKRKGKNQVFAK